MENGTKLQADESACPSSPLHHPPLSSWCRHQRVPCPCPCPRPLSPSGPGYPGASLWQSCCLIPPPNPGEFGVGRFRAAVFTSDCGRRGQGGADVLRIKPGHLLLYPAAKKKQKNTAQMHLSPRPRAIPVPKASTPKRRGRLAAHLRGQRSWRNPGLMYSGHCKNSGD